MTHNINIINSVLIGEEGGVWLENVPQSNLNVNGSYLRGKSGPALKISLTPGLIQQMGLPLSVTEAEVKEAIRALLEARHQPLEQQEKKLSVLTVADKIINAGMKLNDLVNALMPWLDKIIL